MRECMGNPIDKPHRLGTKSEPKPRDVARFPRCTGQNTTTPIRKYGQITIAGATLRRAGWAVANTSRLARECRRVRSVVPQIGWTKCGHASPACMAYEVADISWAQQHFFQLGSTQPKKARRKSVYSYGDRKELGLWRPETVEPLPRRSAMVKASPRSINLARAPESRMVSAAPIPKGTKQHIECAVAVRGLKRVSAP